MAPVNKWVNRNIIAKKGVRTGDSGNPSSYSSSEQSDLCDDVTYDWPAVEWHSVIAGSCPSSKPYHDWVAMSQWDGGSLLWGDYYYVAGKKNNQPSDFKIKDCHPEYFGGNIYASVCRKLNSTEWDVVDGSGGGEPCYGAKTKYFNGTGAIDQNLGTKVHCEYDWADLKWDTPAKMTQWFSDHSGDVADPDGLRSSLEGPFLDYYCGQFWNAVKEGKKGQSCRDRNTDQVNNLSNQCKANNGALMSDAGKAGVTKDCKWLLGLGEGEGDDFTIPAALSDIPDNWYEGAKAYCRSEKGMKDKNSNCACINVKAQLSGTPEGEWNPWCGKQVKGEYVNEGQPGCKESMTGKWKTYQAYLDIYDKMPTETPDDRLARVQVLDMIDAKKATMQNCAQSEVCLGSQWQPYGGEERPDCNVINQFCVHSGINFIDSQFESVDLTCTQNAAWNNGDIPDIPPATTDIPPKMSPETTGPPLWLIIVLSLVGIIILIVLMSGGGGSNNNNINVQQNK